LLWFRCFQLARSKSRAITSRSGLCFGVYRSSIPGDTWILGATLGDGDRGNPMHWYVRRLGRPICRWTDDSSRSPMADDLERSRRGQCAHRLIALYRNSCPRAECDTAVRGPQLVTATLWDRLRQPAIVLMWTCGRSSFRTYDHWRNDLGR